MGSPLRLRRMASGDSIRCTVRSMCQVVVQTPEGSCLTTQVAEYVDTCVKVDGRWRFEQKLVKTVLDGRNPVRTVRQ
jgi:hypothetical protein